MYVMTTSPNIGIPGLGGPFDTTTEFFQARFTKVVFGLPEDKIKESAGQFADGLMASASLFKSAINNTAENISIHNNGVFPLCHGDFGHNNIIFDDKYRLLGVIDWEAAVAGPCEITGEFPLTLSVVLPALDAPWNYDEMGIPRDAEDKQNFADREGYVSIVTQIANEQGLMKGYTLSSALKDCKRQYLATAMRLYQSGKPGWYSNVVESFTGQ
ncbi:putative aminoglycoside phosphotransferase domain-containing protein [Histoplasma ohiense]|nr:putative aminoglycoside phosphotransferase domain-containing protein [Histoplasma ohiense (nom. inval.)]